MDTRPDDHSTLGAALRDECCPTCGHPHLCLACDWCGCDEHVRNGLD